MSRDGIPSDAVCAKMVSIIGPQGIEAPEAGRILGIQAKSAVRILKRAVKIGWLYEARQPHNWNWRIFFSSKEDCDAFAERSVRERKERLAELERRKREKKRAQRAAAAVVAPDVFRRKEFAVELLRERGSLTAAQLAEAAGCNSRQASSTLLSAVAAGQAFTAKLTKHVAVYFASQEAADNLKMVPPKRVRRPKGAAAGKYVVAPEDPGVAPTVTVKNHGRPALRGEMIIPESAKVTKCPAFDGNRWATRDEDGNVLPPPRMFSFRYEVERAEA